jgi:hypothetical protein
MLLGRGLEGGEPARSGADRSLQRIPRPLLRRAWRCLDTWSLGATLCARRCHRRPRNPTSAPSSTAIASSGSSGVAASARCSRREAPPTAPRLRSRSSRAGCSSRPAVWRASAARQSWPDVSSTPTWCASSTPEKMAARSSSPSSCWKAAPSKPRSPDGAPCRPHAPCEWRWRSCPPSRQRTLWASSTAI